MKSARNTTGSPIVINDVGQVTIAAAATYVIPPQDYDLWAASTNVDSYVTAGSIVISDGYGDLKPYAGMLHIHEESLNRKQGSLLIPTLVTISASTLTLVDTSNPLYYLSGTVAGQNIKLPNATTLLVGHRYEFWNVSSQSVALQNNAGTTLFSLSVQQKTQALLQGNSTSDGTWIFEANFLGGTGGGNGPIVFGFDGSASTGRFLELATNVPTDLTKAIIAGSKTLRSLSMGTSGSSTCTVTIYKNGAVLDTIATTATTKNTKLNLAHNFVDKDEVQAKVSSGSSSRPVVFAWL